MGKTENLHIRLSTKEKELIKQVAEKSKLSITDLIIMLVRKEQENNE